MCKVLRFVAFLPFRIISISVIATLFVLEWIGIFLVSMSSWIFNLVATIMFTVSLIGLCMGGITKMECLEVPCRGFCRVYCTVPGRRTDNGDIGNQTEDFGLVMAKNKVT